jgi:hypothetical protein
MAAPLRLLSIQVPHFPLGYCANWTMAFGGLGALITAFIQLI